MPTLGEIAAGLRLGNSSQHRRSHGRMPDQDGPRRSIRDRIDNELECVAPRVRPPRARRQGPYLVSVTVNVFMNAPFR